MPISYQQVYDSMATMLASGLDLKKSLHTSVNGAQKPLHEAVLSVVKSIDRGNTLSRSVIRHPKIFPLLDRTLIDVGEKSGRLPDVFQSLADWYRFRNRIIDIIRAGLTQPVLLLAAAAFIIPLPTIFTDSLFKYISTVLVLLFIFFVPVSVSVILFIKSGEKSGFRMLVEKIFLKIPLVGSAIWNLALARYCFGFRMLYESGVPMENCARISIDLCGNNVIAGMFSGAPESVKHGNPVSEGFSGDLPGDFISIWKIGEESGRLGDTLRKMYEKRIETAEFCFIGLSQWIPRFVYGAVSLFFIMYILRNVSVFIPKI